MTSARFRFRGSAVALTIAAVLAFGTLFAAPAQAVDTDSTRPFHASDVIVGETLTAEVDLATWGDTSDLGYIWLRVPADWSSDGVEITNATDKSYTVTNDDIGSYIRVHVYDGTTRSTSKATNQVLLVRANSQAGPVTIVGDPIIGNTLRVDKGEWAAGTTFTYQWHYAWGGADIAGATTDSFTLTDAQRYDNIEVTVTGTLSGSQEVTSPRSGRILRPAFPSGTVSISGSAVVGSALTATPGDDWPEGAVLSYYWGWSNGEIGDGIEGATDTTFTVPADRVGLQIYVSIEATVANFEPSVAYAFTGIVPPITPVATAPATQAPAATAATAATAPVSTSAELAAFLTAARVEIGTAASAGLPATGLDVTKPYTATVDWAGADGFVDVYAYSTPTLVGTFPVVNGKVQVVLSPAMLSSLAAGTHTLVISGQSSGAVQAVAFSLSKTLAATGVETIVPLGSAALLLLLGAALVVVRHRRTLV
ncbi:hypothetical protein [Cryobacterium sp. Y11]|uniref:hypothetical protein n=1 Tax=Cryobacterium sp. Y11 TaxID=2045016 RepID=UPI000CE35BC9|nr:hypothetical protein [Cryobacterium sp. Y11]